MEFSWFIVKGEGWTENLWTGKMTLLATHVEACDQGIHLPSTLRTALGISVRGFLYRVNWNGMTNPKFGWHWSKGLAHRLNCELNVSAHCSLFPDYGCHVDSCHKLLPSWVHCKIDCQSGTVSQNELSFQLLLSEYFITGTEKKLRHRVVIFQW